VISEFDRPLETATLLDLVSYADLDADEPDTEESTVADEVGKRRGWRIFACYRRSRPATNPRKWLPIKMG
jgi:hypothetical protein